MSLDYRVLAHVYASVTWGALMDTRVFGYPRWLVLALMALSLLLAVLVVSSNNLHLSGWPMLGILVGFPLALGVMGLRYRIVVDATAIEMIGLKRKHFELANVVSIAVQRQGKAGRIATVKFKDGSKLSFSETLSGFRDLLDLLSLRTSIPITKPVWDPNILG